MVETARFLYRKGKYSLFEINKPSLEGYFDIPTTFYLGIYTIYLKFIVFNENGNAGDFEQRFRPLYCIYVNIFFIVKYAYNNQRRVGADLSSVLGQLYTR